MLFLLLLYCWCGGGGGGGVCVCVCKRERVCVCMCGRVFDDNDEMTTVVMLMPLQTCFRLYSYNLFLR